jgi:protocatechuate 3,4-dioxygenase beta subunit
MKPLLVLIAVAAAAAGLFFVLQGGEKSTSDTPGTLEMSDSPEAVEVSGDPAGEVDLVDITNQDAREEGTIITSPTMVAPVSSETNAAIGFGELSGLVTDGKGNPIQNARVTLTKYGSQSFFFDDIDRSTDEVATTGTDGSFSFERVPAYDGYALIATHAEYSRTENSSVIVQDGVMTEAPALVLVPGRKITGMVSDTGGNAVPNALLVLRENAMMAMIDGSGVEDTSTSVQSDKLGKFEFLNVSPGQNYTIEVSADGYGGISTPPVAVLESEDTLQNITLEVASMLAGTVASINGEPIEGVTIQAYQMDNSKSRTNSTTKSDDAGYFEITDIPPGEFQIVARHPLFQPHSRSRAKSGDMNVTIELQPLPRISGQVVDSSTGAPITTFEVQLRQAIAGGQSDLSSADPQTRRRVEHPEGRFEIVATSAGDFMVEGIARGYANTSSEPFTTTIGSDGLQVMIRMTKGGTLTGRVLGGDGAPVQGATVATHDKEWSDDLFWQSMGAGAPGAATETTVTTGADGSYKIEFLTPAEYQVVVRHRDYAQETVKGLTVIEGQTARVPDVQLPQGAEISGTVIGPSGSPLAGATVKMFPTTQNARTYNAQTNKNGEYRIKNIRQGSYKIHATRPRTSADNPFQENIDLKSTQRTLTLQEGSTMAGEDFKLSDR